ncbi:hypothetical protein [Vibrio breoganii]|nr:hypothetical protein [Vibrio breoganii]
MRTVIYIMSRNYFISINKRVFLINDARPTADSFNRVMHTFAANHACALRSCDRLERNSPVVMVEVNPEHIPIRPGEMLFTIHDDLTVTPNLAKQEGFSSDPRRCLSTFDYFRSNPIVTWVTEGNQSQAATAQQALVKLLLLSSALNETLKLELMNKAERQVKEALAIARALLHSDQKSNPELKELNSVLRILKVNESRINAKALRC